MKKLLFLVFIMIFGASCSPKKKTQASFKLSVGNLIDGAGTAQFPGGLMLYGKSQGKSFARAVIGADMNEIIPNGTWDFYAVGWNAANGEMAAGKAYCSAVRGVTLNGDAIVIDMFLNNGECTAGEFGGFINGGGIATFTNTPGSGFFIYSCNEEGMDQTDALLLSNKCPYTPAPDTNYKNLKGHAMSYLVEIPSYDRIGPNVNEHGSLISECVDVSASNMADLALNFPQGNGVDTPFTLKVTAFFSPGCDGLRGAKEMIFPNGLATYNFDTKTQYSAGAVHAFVRLDDFEVCADPFRTYAGDYASGNGSPQFPHVICSAEQFNAVGSSATAMSNNYLLADNLDFNHLRMAFDFLNAPNCAVGPGDNINPFGADCTSGYSVPAPFTGVFDGNDKLMSSISLELDSSSGSTPVGIFPSLSGTILNLNLKKIEVFADDLGGSLVGQMNSGSTLYNINVENVWVKSYQSGTTTVILGGVVGSANSATIELVQGRDIYLEGESNTSSASIYFGGLVGEMVSTSVTSSVIKDSMVRGDIGGGGTLAAVGGIIGKNTSGGTIQYVGFTGMVNANERDTSPTTYAGGIVGYSASSPTTINDVYVNGLITSQDTAKMMGLNMAPANYFVHTQTCSAGVCNCNEATCPSLGSSSVASVNTVGLKVDRSDTLNEHVRFSFEKESPCETLDGGMQIGEKSLATQSGGATPENPKYICTSTQLQEFSNNNFSGYIEVANNIGIMSTLLNSSDGTFSGSMDGKHKILYGGSGTGSNAPRLLHTIGSAGSISDLKLFSHEIGSMGSGDYYAPTPLQSTGLQTVGQKSSILAEYNYGEISNIIANGKIFVKEGAGLVKYNHGVIAKSEFKGEIGGARLGGIVYDNTSAGVIYDTISDARMYIDGQGGGAVSGDISSGGIASVNTGIIETSQYSGSINILFPPDTATPYNINIGNISGENYGIISDVLVTKEANMHARYYDGATRIINNFGGISGLNDGDIYRSIFVGRISDVSQNTTKNSDGLTVSGSGSVTDSIFSRFYHEIGFFTSEIADTVSVTSSSGYLTVSCADAGAATCHIFGGDSFSDLTDYIASENNGSYIYTATITSSVSTGTAGGNTINHTGGTLAGSKFSMVREVTAGQTETQIQDINTYTAGFDVAEMTGGGAGYGEARLLDYHLSILSGVEPINPPIWEFKSGEGMKLISLDHK